MARLTSEDKAHNERAIRAAMDRMLNGVLPAGAKCDLKALADQAGVGRTGFYPKKNRDGTTRPGPYQHLAEEFERRRTALAEAGTLQTLGSRRSSASRPRITRCGPAWPGGRP